MTKAKILDRLKLTAENFGLKSVDEQGNVTHLSKCPECGAESLRLDSGCMSCLSCGWSKC